MGFSLIYVCFVTHILSLNPWTFFILIGCCTYYDNLSKAKLVGHVFAGGTTTDGNIANHPQLEIAYQMGKNI